MIKIKFMVLVLTLVLAMSCPDSNSVVAQYIEPFTSGNKPNFSTMKGGRVSYAIISTKSKEVIKGLFLMCSSSQSEMPSYLRLEPNGKFMAYYNGYSKENPMAGFLNGVSPDVYYTMMLEIIRKDYNLTIEDIGYQDKKVYVHRDRIELQLG